MFQQLLLYISLAGYSMHITIHTINFCLYVRHMLEALN